MGLFKWLYILCKIDVKCDWHHLHQQAVNPPWQQPARPPPPQVVSNISLSSPVQSSQVQTTAQPPVSYNIQGVQPPMGISTSIQQPVGMQQPGHMHMPAPVAPPSHYSSAGGPVPPPWQSNTMTSQNSAVSSAGGGKIIIRIFTSYLFLCINMIDYCSYFVCIYIEWYLSAFCFILRCTTPIFVVGPTPSSSKQPASVILDAAR